MDYDFCCGWSLILRVQHPITASRHAVFQYLVFGIAFLAGAGGTADHRAAAAHGDSTAATTENAADGSAYQRATKSTLAGRSALAGVVGESGTFGEVFFIGGLVYAFGINHNALLWRALAGGHEQTKRYSCYRKKFCDE